MVRDIFEQTILVSLVGGRVFIRDYAHSGSRVVIESEEAEDPEAEEQVVGSVLTHPSVGARACV